MKSVHKKGATHTRTVREGAGGEQEGMSGRKRVSGILFELTNGATKEMKEQKIFVIR